MSQDTKELRVSGEENSKRIMYLAKEFLLNNDVLDIVSGTRGAITVTKAAEALKRLNYVTYDSIKTETVVVNDRRRTGLVVRVKKTSQFSKLYQENVENRKKLVEEKEAGTKK
jgi:hypothetical protein